MSSKLTKPHDHFFRSSMSDIRVARGFFRKHLPKEIRALIDIDSITQQKDDFLGENLIEQIPDLVYTAKFKEEDRCVYFVIEHQSTQKRKTPLKLLQYALSVVDDHSKKTSDSQLTLVYSILVFNGKKPYKPPINLIDMFGEHKELAKNMLLGRFQSIDLSRFEDEEPKEDPFYDLVARIMKHIHDSYDKFMLFLDEISQDLINLEKSGEMDYIYRIVNYVTAALMVTDKKEFSEIIKKCLPTSIEEEIFMTTGAEILRKEGKTLEEFIGEVREARGITKAIREMASKLLKKGMSISEIAELTGLSAQEIQV